jgi:hypothetical protein
MGTAAPLKAMKWLIMNSRVYFIENPSTQVTQGLI